jgi:DNA-binding transcriptional MerR regulator
LYRLLNHLLLPLNDPSLLHKIDNIDPKRLLVLDFEINLLGQYGPLLLALEKEGYVFQKNQQGHRIFTDEDIQTLEGFMELIKYDGMTIEFIAKKIRETKGHDSITEPKEDSHTVMNLVETVVNNALQKQEQHYSEQITALANQYSSEVKALVNQIEALKSEQLRESMEQKKLMIETKEEILLALKEQAAGHEQKKGFWVRLFGK